MTSCPPVELRRDRIIDHLHPFLENLNSGFVAEVSSHFHLLENCNLKSVHVYYLK